MRRTGTPVSVPYGRQLETAVQVAVEALWIQLGQMRDIRPTYHPEPTDVQVYGSPDVTSYNRNRFDPSEWSSHVRGRFGSEACSIEFSCDRSTPATVFVGCSCGADMGEIVCAHINALAGHIRSPSFDFRFDGILERPTEGPETLDASLVSAFEGLDDGPQANIPEGKRLGLRIVEHARGVGLEPVAFGSPLKNPASNTARVDPVQILCQAPAEQAWADRLRVLFAAPSAMSRSAALDTPADLRTLVAFADDGRLLDVDSKPLRIQHGLHGLFEWRQEEDGALRLVSARAGPTALRWFDQEYGVALDPVDRSLRFLGIPAARFGELASWPPLDEADIDDVGQALRAHPALASLPPPLAAAPLPVREVELQWRLTFTALPDRLEVLFTPMVEGEEVALRDQPVVKVRRGDVWLRYSNDLRPVQDACTNLRAAGFYLAGDLRMAARLEPGMLDEYRKSEISYRVAVALLCEPWLSELPTQWEGVDPVRVVHANTPVAQVSLKPRQRGAVVDLGVTLGDVSLAPDQLRRIPVVAALLANRPVYGYEEGGLQSIAPGVFARVDAEAWARVLEPVIPLLRLARPHGKALVLDAGAMAGLIAAGVPLPDAPLLAPLRLAVQEVLSAKDAEANELAQVPRVDACQYWPFQRQGLAWLTALRKHGFGGVLADDRGLGKTLEVLGAAVLHLNARRARGEQAPPVLVLVERKEKKGWSDHLAKHLAQVDTHWEHGATRLHRTEDLASKEIVLTTYDIYIRNPELFQALEPEFVFCDEATSLKNSKTARWKQVGACAGATIVPITGTPVDRNIDHLWSLTSLAVPGLLGRQDELRARYAALVGRDDAQARQARDELRKTLAPFVLRRTKDELRGQIPDKREIVQPVEMAPAEAAAYEQLRSRMDAERQDLCASRPFHQAKFLMSGLADRLRAMCARVGTPKQPTSKGTYLLEMCQELLAAGHRPMIFSHFNGEVGAISELLRSHGISTAEYVGGNAAQRDRELALFKDGHMQVLVLSAWGSSGLDCPEADTVIIADTWINMGQDDQMGDRAHRLVSGSDVTVFKLAAAGTIEEFACEFIERNRASTEGLFSEAHDAAIGAIGLRRDDYDCMFTISPAAAP